MVKLGMRRIRDQPHTAHTATEVTVSIELSRPRDSRPAPTPSWRKLTLIADEWELFRQAWLAALRDAPGAFADRFQDEASYGDEVWRGRMTRARRIVAERDDELVGVVGVGLHGEDPETSEVFGLWTAPTARGERAAWDLVTAAARAAVEDGARMLYFWAGSDNPAAIGFASSFGFRPTEERRPMQPANEQDAGEDTALDADGQDGDEVALVLPLSPDPKQPVGPSLS